MHFPIAEPGASPPPFPTDREVEPPPRQRSPVRVAHEAARRVLLRVMDTGRVPGLKPLELHVVLCGFPRAGTTMLQAMAQTCYRDCRTYAAETSAYFIAQVGLRNHPYLITKRPNDIFWVRQILDLYAGRKAQARVVMLKRDPRAVLTSRFEGIEGYYVSPKVWHAYYQHFVSLKDDPRLLVLSYEDLVRAPDAVQARFSTFTGLRPVHRFSEFDRFLAPSFDGPVRKALNGVRPPDPASIDKWRAPKHGDRIRALLDAIPAFPEMLVQLGYEPDAAWTEAYR